MLQDQLGAENALPLKPAGAFYSPEDQVTVLYDLSGTTALYIGYGVQGTATSDPLWTIRKITLTSGSPSASNWTAKGTAVWDNRSSETYL